MKIKLMYLFIVVLTSYFAENNAYAHNKVVVVPLLGDDAKVSKQTITQNFTPGDFNSAFTSNEYFINTGQEFRFNSSTNIGSIGLSVGLNLPKGAEIKSLTCYVEDNDSNFNFGFASSAEVNRRLKTSTSTESVETNDLILTTSGSAAGLLPHTITAFDHPIIDNSNYFYTLYVFFQLATSAGGFVTLPVTADIRFYGCSMDYELNVVTVP